MQSVQRMRGCAWWDAPAVVAHGRGAALGGVALRRAAAGADCHFQRRPVCAHGHGLPRARRRRRGCWRCRRRRRGSAPLLRGCGGCGGLGLFGVLLATTAAAGFAARPLAQLAHGSGQRYSEGATGWQAVPAKPYGVVRRTCRAIVSRRQPHGATSAAPHRAARSVLGACRPSRRARLRAPFAPACGAAPVHKSRMQTAVPAAAPSGNGAAPSAAGVTGKGRLSIVMPPSPPDSRPATCEDGGQQTGNALVEVGPRSPRPSGGGSDRTPRRSSGGTPREGRPPLARQSSGGGGRGAFGSSTPRFSGATDGEGSRSGRLSRGDGERGRSPSESGGGDGARQPRVSGSAARPPRRLSATGVALSDARREQLGRIERVRTRPGACAALTSKRADRTRPAN